MPGGREGEGGRDRDVFFKTVSDEEKTDKQRKR